MERNLGLEFVRATEAAALSAGRWVGKGDRHAVDHAACEAMRRVLNDVDINGIVVIGEGERDEAPMLFIGEEVGTGKGPQVQIAVDPVEGTNLVANGAPGAISVMAAAFEGEGNLLHAPDTYMDKLVVGPAAKGAVDITLPVKMNLKVIAKCLNKDVPDLTVGVLDRPRHEELIRDVRSAGARIRLVSDGDLSLGLEALDPNGEVDVLMGIGGAPEGVLSAAACICMDGEIQGRLVFRNESERERAKKLFGSDDVDRVLMMDDLAQGNVVFAATGITGGNLLQGVRYTGWGAVTHSIVMRSRSGTIRTIETHHHFSDEPRY
jgi:fructose-1,6-bisphosphatase class II